MLARLFLILIALVFIIPISDFLGIHFWPSSKWGFIDSQSKLIIPAIFDRVQGIGEGSFCYTFRPQKSFHEGMAAIAIGKLWGFVDKNGRVAIKPQYDSVGDFSQGLACVESGKKCGFIDHSGKMVIPAKYSPHWLYCGHMYFRDGLCPVELLDGSMGYIDRLGAYVVKPKFDSAWPFSQGRAVVSLPHALNNILMDTKGKIIFETKNSRIVGNCADGLLQVSATCADNTNVYQNWYIDRDGKTVTKKFKGQAKAFSEGLAAVNLDSESFGYVNHRGEVVIQPSFHQVSEFQEGLAAVAIEDKKEKSHYIWGYINKTGAWVIPPQYDCAGDFSEGRARVRKGASKEGFIDKNGNVVIPANYAQCFPFSEGLAAVKM